MMMTTSTYATTTSQEEVRGRAKSFQPKRRNNTQNVLDWPSIAKKGRTADIWSGSGQQPTRGRVVNIFELDAGEEEAPATVFFSFVCPGLHVTKPIEEEGEKGEEEAL